MFLDKDAFSSGQIGSKIWLAECLEDCILDLQFKGLYNQPLKIAIIGGWYGLLNFIIQSRNLINIEYVRSIDIDSEACEQADLINNLWVWQNWKFKSLCRNANDFEFFDFDLIINSAIEHIPTKVWWDNIPEGKLVVLQSNDMDHDDHVANHLNIEEFSNDFPLTNTLLLKSKLFQYDDWKFTRFMKIGVK